LSISGTRILFSCVAGSTIDGMLIFSKPMSQVGTADLQELLSDNAVENARLEFKLQVPTKDETLKKLSSFANTFGGFMVVGASALSADGRIDGLPGVDVEAGYKQKVVDWCFSAVSPPLVVEVSDPIPVPAGGGRVCYVIRTAESEVAPHFLNGRNGVWVRTDEFSARFEARLADENELRHLFDRRKLIRDRRANLLERARKRSDAYAARTQTDGSGNRTRLGSLLEFCIVPRFPARPVCEQERLRSFITASYVSWRGVTFPKPSNSIISQHESAIVLDANGDWSIFEANVWGMLFYCTKIDRDENKTPGIHPYEVVGKVMLFIRHADSMLLALGYVGPVLIETSLTSILGVGWLNIQRRMLFPNRHGSELDDDVTFSVETTSEALHEKPDGVAMDVLRYIFFSANLPDLIDPPQRFEELVRMGYEYNSWTPPDTLRI
jgi:hypothetical protein